MDVVNIVKTNKILAILTLMTIIGVLMFDIYHYSPAYGVTEINNVNTLFLVPFIVLVCGFGILLGSTKLQDEFEVAYKKRLTKREKEVIALIISGKRNQEISDELFVDISPIKSHINSIYRKIQVKNRKQLIQIGESVLKEG